MVEGLARDLESHSPRHEPARCGNAASCDPHDLVTPREEPAAGRRSASQQFSARCPCISLGATRGSGSTSFPRTLWQRPRSAHRKLRSPGGHACTQPQDTSAVAVGSGLVRAASGRALVPLKPGETRAVSLQEKGLGAATGRPPWLRTAIRVRLLQITGSRDCFSGAQRGRFCSENCFLKVMTRSITFSQRNKLVHLKEKAPSEKHKLYPLESKMGQIVDKLSRMLLCLIIAKC